MELSTIFTAVAIMVGLIALLSLLIWFDVAKRGNPPPDGTGTVGVPPEQLGPRWTGSDSGGIGGIGG